jgi:hypothetical protein
MEKLNKSNKNFKKLILIKNFNKLFLLNLRSHVAISFILNSDPFGVGRRIHKDLSNPDYYRASIECSISCVLYSVNLLFKSFLKI